MKYLFFAFCACGGAVQNPVVNGAIEALEDPQVVNGTHDAQTLEDLQDLADRFIGDGSDGLSMVVRQPGFQDVLIVSGQASAGEAVTSDTVFELGSVTKQYTAAMILRAVETGRLALDDELHQHLPSYPATTYPITVRHLLTHTAGLPNYTASPGFADTPDRTYSQAELIALFSDQELQFEPGSAFNYSNSGYFLLGMILEAAYDMPYDQLLETELFEPLELDQTGYCDVDPSTTPRATGMRDNAPVTSTDMSQPFAAGALCGTAPDAVAWNDALLRGLVVDTAMDQPQQLSSGANIPYGFGLFVGRTKWRSTVSHGGNIPGFTSRIAYYPDAELHVVILTNRDGADLAGLEIDIVNTILGPLERPAVPPFTSTEAAPYVASYGAAGLPPMEVLFDGELQVRIGGSPPLSLIRVGELDFEQHDTGLRFRFVGDDRLEVEQAGVLMHLHEVSD